MLEQLGSDAWAVVLAGLRTVLADARVAGDAELTSFRDAPTSRLVGGRLRTALARRLSADPELWAALVQAPALAGEVPEELERLRTGDDLRTATSGGIGGVGGVGEERESGRGRQAAQLAKRRLREAREEREAWRRRAGGAEARAEQLSAELGQAHLEAEQLRSELQLAREQLRDADRDRERAVERERRRRTGELEALEGQLAELRRDEQERRADLRRRAEHQRQTALDAARSASDAQRRATEDRPPRVVPGRPSRLPRGVEPGTTEAARELLHRGRLLLIDGYNVTKQHRSHLDLETQRTWLVQQVGVLARQRGVVPTIVFDGQISSGNRPAIALRDVRVRFSEAGITADDELVLAVVGTDEPVVVVTDDRELAARVEAHGADVVGTRSFLGVLP